MRTKKPFVPLLRGWDDACLCTSIAPARKPSRAACPEDPAAFGEGAAV